MAKIKFDVSGTDPKDSKGRGDLEQAPKGVYVSKFIEVAPHTTDNGKSIKVVVQPRDGKKLYGYVYSYVPLGDGAGQWRLDQFVQALGLANDKKKRTGTIDTSALEGKEIGVRLKAGANQEGEYRAEVATWLAVSDIEESKSDEDEDDDEPDEDEEESEEEEDEDDEEEEDEDEEEEEDEGYTKEDLKALDEKALKKVAKELGVKVKKTDKKSAIIKAVLAAQEAAGDDEDDEDDEALPF